MKSYFFIPANKEKFLEQACNIKADEIILDLEDAIYNSNIQDAVNNIIHLNLSNEYFIRVINTYKKNIDDYKYLLPLIRKGFNKFVLPKIEGSNEIDEFVSFVYDNMPKKLNLSLIVLIENPKALHNLSEIAQSEYIEAIGLGSHDYCDSMGMEHTSENILWARMNLLNTVKAFEKMPIDIASMNIKDEKEFKEECLDGISKGFDAKFIIHPWQLDILNNLSNFNSEEILFAKKVKQFIDSIGGESNFSITKIDGQIVEKPHLKRINNILKSIGYGTIKNG
jgi:citrate lyase beta subunit